MRNSHDPQDRGNRHSRNDEFDDRFRAYQSNQQRSRTASSGNYEDRDDARFDPSGDRRRTSQEYYGQGNYSRDYGQQGPQRSQRSMHNAYGWGQRDYRGGYQDRQGDDDRWRGIGPGRYQDREPSWGSEYSRHGDDRSERDQGDLGRHESGYGSQYSERDYRVHSGHDQPRDSAGRFGETRGSQQPRGPKGWQRSDERIKDDVSERLYHHRGVDCSDVSVEVSGGKVTLEGTVPERRMKHAIEDMVDQCPGVKDIENRIRVQRNGEGGSSGSSHTSGTSGGGSHATSKDRNE